MSRGLGRALAALVGAGCTVAAAADLPAACTTGRHIVNGREFVSYAPPGDGPFPVLLVFHGWTDSALVQAQRDHLHLLRDEGWLVIYPEGSGDVPEKWQEWSWDLGEFGWKSWQSWNGSGTVGSPGNLGSTCITHFYGADYYEEPDQKEADDDDDDAVYDDGDDDDDDDDDEEDNDAPCYLSCGECKDPCWWTTCMDDVAFVVDLLNTATCASKVFATGFSNGAAFLYELASRPEMKGRLEAILPVAGSPMVGFQRPLHTPLYGLWGLSDTTVPPLGMKVNETYQAPSGVIYTANNRPREDLGLPVNVAISDDGWLWTGAENFTGPPGSKWETPMDGEKGLYCETRWYAYACFWDGGHEWAGSGWLDRFGRLSWRHALRQAGFPLSTPLATRWVRHIIGQPTYREIGERLALNMLIVCLFCIVGVWIRERRKLRHASLRDDADELNQDLSESFLDKCPGVSRGGQAACSKPADGAVTNARAASQDKMANELI
eukprot:TRINITY_DN1317_c4_g1_i1.p1 TRINITY_DN1317_c4_g1~~TRINITY_DN1317_c4_g1_i1.p1  ORF type:complete len:492 (+),score=75.44 TRINITY_DN1317_c4_g1_i1:69-1544(+)